MLWGCMRILVAPDKFKGSLTAVEVGDAIRDGIRQARPAVEVDVLPVADGGEGFADVLGRAGGLAGVVCEACDALGRPVSGRYFLGGMDGRLTAAMEMSAVNGLAMIPEEERDPMWSNTRGTGLMLLDAARRGARRILIGIGGSATNDIGLGMASAFGHTLLDADGRTLNPVPARFPAVASLAGGSSFPRDLEVVVACDVDNPLCGPRGATSVYGPQKGLRPEDIDWLDGEIRRIAALIPGGVGHIDTPGAGAAGGLGFGLMVFADGRLGSGFDMVADVLDLDTAVRGADLVVAAEGHLDRQSGMGKATGRLRDLARTHGKPTLAVAGRVSDSAGFDTVLSLETVAESTEDSMRRARDHIRAIVADWADNSIDIAG